MEFVTGVDEYISSGMLPYYYLCTLIGFISLLWYFGINRLSVFIALIFWDGMIYYFCSNLSNVAVSVYKIFLPIYALVIFGNKVDWRSNKTDQFINIVFILLTLVFSISIIIHDEDLLTAGSQFGKKYLLPFLFYHGFKKTKNLYKIEYIFRIIKFSIIIQAVFSVVKLALLGFGESISGSITYRGGAPGNILPVLAFILFWVATNGKLTSKYWYLILSLLLIGIVGNKRSIWFIFPLAVAAIYYYVQNIQAKRILKYVPIALLIFYFGVRLNPSLNPERSRWGSFNFEHVFNYTNEYTFGDEEQNDSEIGYGKGGGLIVLFSQTSTNYSLMTYLFGNGLSEIVGHDYESFNSKKYAVASKASVGGAFSNFISLGLFGMLLILFLGFSIIKNIKNRRLRIVLYLYFTYEYFLFGGAIFSITAHALIFAFICVYYNIRFHPSILAINNNEIKKQYFGNKPRSL